MTDNGDAEFILTVADNNGTGFGAAFVGSRALRCPSAPCTHWKFVAAFLGRKVALHLDLIARKAIDARAGRRENLDVDKPIVNQHIAAITELDEKISFPP
jgi:hypothetical protein